jgi:DNA replication protein DnaC
LPDSEAGDSIVERDSGLPQKVYAKVTLGERVGQRARSRLFEMCRVVHMPTVRDYRLPAGR